LAGGTDDIQPAASKDIGEARVAGAVDQVRAAQAQAQEEEEEEEEAAAAAAAPLPRTRVWGHLAAKQRKELRAGDGAAATPTHRNRFADVAMRWTVGLLRQVRGRGHHNITCGGKGLEQQTGDQRPEA
jgi:hypothetical protein